MNELTPDEHRILIDAIHDSATVVHKGRKKMNERIRQLAEQASHQSPDGYPVTIPYSKDFAKKFAELIVAECLEACSRANDIRHFVPPTQEQVVLSCMREIEQHFGVEE